MENYTLQAGFPETFQRSYRSFTLRYSDGALEVASKLGLDMTYLPLQLNTSRAELVEVIRDGDTTEWLHYRVRMGDREIVLVISMIHRGWRVMNFLEVDGVMANCRMRPNRRPADPHLVDANHNLPIPILVPSRMPRAAASALSA